MKFKRIPGTQTVNFNPHQQIYDAEARNLLRKKLHKSHRTDKCNKLSSNPNHRQSDLLCYISFHDRLLLPQAFLRNTSKKKEERPNKQFSVLFCSGRFLSKNYWLARFLTLVFLGALLSYRAFCHCTHFSATSCLFTLLRARFFPCFAAQKSVEN